MKSTWKPWRWAALLAAVTVATVACRAETQNRFGREILDLANTKQYITVFTIAGQPVMRGEVRGKVTRAEETTSGGTGGEYVYWFDYGGKYWQTSMPYIVTTDPNQTGLLTSPSAPPSTTTR